MRKNILLFIILIAVLASGCQTSALDQAATMIAETVTAAPPSDTPRPVFTLLPLNTPILKSTATPNVALTTTVEAFNVLFELDVQVGTNSAFRYEEGQLAWKQNEPITIHMTGPQKDLGIFHALDKSIHATNFIFKSDVTWNAVGVLICGLAFRTEENLDRGKQYQFYFYRLSGLPAYKIDVYDLGRFKNTITDVKFSDQINVDNESTNQFVLAAQDEQFTIYINGKRQGDFYDSSKQRSDGLLAFLAWQDSGKGSCTFKNSWVWVLP